MPTLRSVERRYLSDAWHEARTSFEVRGPADGEVIAEIADVGPDLADHAASVAWSAFESWRSTTAFERAEVLRRWHDLMLRDQEALARTMTREMGKPIREARGEIAYAAGFVAWYAEEGVRVQGETFQTNARHKRGLALRQPVGPVYAITPWNFPAAMITRKVAPALAAGCTAIVKPAEQTPLTALMLAELWLEAGGPDGTLQVLPTSDPAPLTEALLADPRIRKLTFTGSTEVGKILYRRAADTVKRISLELGGHAPFLVFEDADVEHAVRETLSAKFRNAGQTCVCTNRIYVHASIADAFTDAYVAAAGGLVVGDPMRDVTDIGPLVDRAGLDKVREHVADALDRGATLRLGGEPDGASGNGLYYPPTVLTGVTSEMRLMHEETFGPVAPIVAFENDEDAVAQANATPYGLAAYLYTNDLRRAWWAAEALEYGIVGVNDGLPSAPHAPFGGVKESGLGREGGPWGIDEYLEIKYVSMGLGR